MIEFGTFGSIGIDDLVFPNGSTKFNLPGGGAIYSALGMALWGARPSVVAPFGPGYPIDAVSARLDLSTCPRIDRTMRNWGLYESNGHRTFLLQSTTRDYRTFCASRRDVGEHTFRHCHVAPAPWDMQIELVDHLRACGAETISVDPDDVSLPTMGRERLQHLLRGCDVFLPSQLDVNNMLPGADAATCIRSLRELVPDVPVIAVKQSENGVVVHPAGSSELLLVPAVTRDVVDVTGAGDAFSGGTLIGYAQTRDPLEAVLRGSVSASFAVASFGPSALLDATAEEASTRLNGLRSRVARIRT